MVDERGRGSSGRIAATVAIALFVALFAYLLTGLDDGRGVVSISFLLLLPAAICGSIGAARDTHGTGTLEDYLVVVPVSALALTVISAVLLREGVICIVMLLPIWLVSGTAGAVAARALRHRAGDTGRAYSSVLLLVPLMGMYIEATNPPAWTQRTVTRSVVIDAPPAGIWPLLTGIGDVKPGEGRWNFAQDVIGIPRPLGAKLDREGVGAVRSAHWERGVRFEERVTSWEVGRQIGWNFVFTDREGWRLTDKHLTPDSAYFLVTTGGYRMATVGNGQTRVELHTTYRMRTPLTAYAQMWGELVLGDLHRNLLGMIKDRAESAEVAQSLALTPSAG